MAGDRATGVQRRPDAVLSAPVEQALVWPKRAKCDRTAIAERRTWQSQCGRYRVEEHVYPNGEWPTGYLAIRIGRISGRWAIEFPTIISRHKLQAAAFAACERDRKGTS